ncbi:hypothetical protein NKH18_38425 [Streptomyces sp. M10(2022)]
MPVNPTSPTSTAAPDLWLSYGAPASQARPALSRLHWDWYENTGPDEALLGDVADRDVAELGAGSARQAAYVAQVMKPARVIALDSSATQHDRSVSLYGDVPAWSWYTPTQPHIWPSTRTRSMSPTRSSARWTSGTRKCCSLRSLGRCGQVGAWPSPPLATTTTAGRPQRSAGRPTSRCACRTAVPARCNDGSSMRPSGRSCWTGPDSISSPPTRFMT